MALERLLNTPTPDVPSTPWTTLSAGVNAVVTALPVVSSSAFGVSASVQTRILVISAGGAERMLVTGGFGTGTLTVTRGIEGTTAVAHGSGALVYGHWSAGAVLNNPGPMMTLGDTTYLDANGNVARLPAPVDGDYALRFTIGVPSYVATGAGTVTSVALTVPTGEFSLTGSPITGAGTFAISKASIAANLVAAGPATGSAAAWGFRSLVVADIPGITEAKLSFTDITTANATASLHGLLPKLSGNAAQFLAGDGSWSAPAGSGDALTSLPLSQFASTTSAQLAGVLSDETGFASGALAVFSKSPAIETPTIASFANATHSHLNAAGGGTLDAAAIAAGTMATARLGSGTANSTTFLRGDSTWATPAGGGAPGGADTQLQFNNAGAFGGSANLTWDGTTFAASRAIVGGSNSALTSLDAAEGPFNFATTGSVIAVHNNGSSELIFARGDGVDEQESLGSVGLFYVKAFVEPDLWPTLGAFGVETQGDPANGAIPAYWYFTATPIGGSAPETQVYFGWSEDHGGGNTSMASLWFPMQNGATAGREYILWKDAPDTNGNRHVWRLNTEGIVALYNKDFGTIYTPGAADYERGIGGQWASNVYQIGTEASGSGTLRVTQILGASLVIPAASGTWNLASATVTLPTSQTITTPTIASFTNATHTHTNAAGGGTLDAAAIAAGTVATARLGSGTADSTTFLRGDNTWAIPGGGGGGGDALVANPLSQFAATTSLQLLGVISDETGTGALVFANTPTLVTPVLGVATGTRLTLSPSGAAGLTVTGATETTSQNLISATQTWNASGTTFTAVDVNITDTASAAASLVANWRVGGTTIFQLKKNGYTAQSGSMALGGDLVFEIYSTLAKAQGRDVSGRDFTLERSGIHLASAANIQWSSRAAGGGLDTYGNGDVGMKRASAGVLEVNTSVAGTFATITSLYSRVGAGAPEAAVTAPVGAVFHRTDGGAGTSFYVKESGAGNTGWIAK